MVPGDKKILDDAVRNILRSHCSSKEMEARLDALQKLILNVRNPETFLLWRERYEQLPPGLQKAQIEAWQGEKKAFLTEIDKCVNLWLHPTGLKDMALIAIGKIPQDKKNIVDQALVDLRNTLSSAEAQIKAQEEMQDRQKVTAAALEGDRKQRDAERKILEDRIKQLEDRNKQLEDKDKLSGEQYRKLETEVGTVRSQSADFKQRLEEERLKTTELENKFKTESAKVLQLEGDLSTKTAHLNTAQGNIGPAEQRARDAERRAKELQDSVNQLESQLDQERKERKDMDDKYKKLKDHSTTNPRKGR